VKYRKNEKLRNRKVQCLQGTYETGVVDMHFQWYPGHMTKAKRMMEENIKLIDLIIELVDARIPLSSRNPDIDELGKHKARLILLNKADLAQEHWNDRWVAYFQEKGYSVLKVNSKKGGRMKSVLDIIEVACKEKRERDRKKGILNRPVRAMVVGIPNVGKSTFINAIAGRAATKTGNKPGVTKGKQWIRLNKNIELLDTPGILWPKFEDQQVGLNLAFIGSIKDDLLNIEDLALSLIAFLLENYPNTLKEKYSVTEMKDSVIVLQEVAKNRNCIGRGSELDLVKASGILLDDFRNGRIGRITLEHI
jgi:ribosome biogenesis GTPase A